MIFFFFCYEFFRFWRLHCTKDDRDITTEIEVTQEEKLFSESPKLVAYCTVSITNTVSSKRLKFLFYVNQISIFCLNNAKFINNNFTGLKIESF